jgi:nucleoside-diphosphate-sugar epimerase
MIVLIAGTTGYVGSRLVPVLLRAGHEVRAGTRSREALEGYWWSDQVTPVDLDVNDADVCSTEVASDSVSRLTPRTDADISLIDVVTCSAAVAISLAVAATA